MKTALVIPLNHTDQFVAVQFDDMTQPEAFGWSTFARKDFIDVFYI